LRERRNVVAVLKVIPAYGRNGWQAVIERGGKATVIETGLSRTKAYYAACHLHHWDGDKPN
jgi:hypothetical protein